MWGTRERRRSAIEEQKNLLEENGAVTSILIRTEVGVGSWIKSIAKAYAYGI